MTRKTVLHQAALEEQTRRAAELEAGRSALEGQAKTADAELCMVKEKLAAALAVGEQLATAEAELSALRERLIATEAERAALEERLAAAKVEGLGPQADAEGLTLEAAQAEWARERDELVAQAEDAEDARVRAEEKFAKIKALMQVSSSTATVVWVSTGLSVQLIRFTVDEKAALQLRLEDNCEPRRSHSLAAVVAVLHLHSTPPDLALELRRRPWRRARRCRRRWRN